MTSDVVLTAALRNNLLSLQNTQSVIDIAQNRLSTGRKVNSALDNPQSFFASQALNNRAADLTRLLDTIGQSIQVIKAADNGVTALTKLVQQADSIAQSARDALASGQVEAKAVGERNLSAINNVAAVSGIQNGDTLVLSLTDSNGNAINVGSYNTTAGSAAARHGPAARRVRQRAGHQLGEPRQRARRDARAVRGRGRGSDRERGARGRAAAAAGRAGARAPHGSGAVRGSGQCAGGWRGAGPDPGRCRR